MRDVCFSAFVGDELAAAVGAAEPEPELADSRGSAQALAAAQERVVQLEAELAACHEALALAQAAAMDTRE